MKNPKLLIGIIAAIVVIGGVAVWKMTSHTTSVEDKAKSTAEEIIDSAKATITQEAKHKIEDVYMSAKEAYKIAEESAKKWDGNAYLVSLDNFSGSKKADGTAEVWIFKFGSDAKNDDGYTLYRVRVNSGEVVSAYEDTVYSKPSKVVASWIDSDKAMEKALPHFEGLTCLSYWLGLAGEKWNIKCSKEGGPTWVYLNASTGAFIKTREGY